MSTSWDIRCVDCNTGMGFDVNHGEQDLLELLEHRELWEAMPEPVVSIRWEGRRLFDDFWPGMFAAHKGHTLILRNEYGTNYGDCTRRYQCGECGTRHPCGKLENHTGPHGPKEES